jgi:hypothetical protein
MDFVSVRVKYTIFRQICKRLLHSPLHAFQGVRVKPSTWLKPILAETCHPEGVTHYSAIKIRINWFVGPECAKMGWKTKNYLFSLFRRGFLWYISFQERFD